MQLSKVEAEFLGKVLRAWDGYFPKEKRSTNMEEERLKELLEGKLDYLAGR